MTSCSIEFPGCDGSGHPADAPDVCPLYEAFRAAQTLTETDVRRGQELWATLREGTEGKQA